uniref:Peripheral plasma membrane protein CASK n=1 Tax=Schistocephalus solidus TaxID=70667 RepID=A0A0X3NYM0_SCHSO
MRRKKANESTPLLFSELPFQTYEEVILHPAFRRKTVVLLGAHGVGRRTLRRSLVQSRPDLFANTVSHTTRKPEPYEIDGVHFYFVQKEEMASDILNKEFLEYGTRKNILFGTRLDSVRKVMSSGRLPVLDVEPKALRILRSAEFAPFVIFIAPPCLSLLIRDSMHETMNSALAKLNKESEIMEYVYRPYIDKVVVHQNVDDSIQEIIDFITETQESKQWVPISWVF